MSPNACPETAIQEVITTINRTCKEGSGFDRLQPLFHEEVVIVQPHLKGQAKGRDICLQSYSDACSQMTFEKLDASDMQIEVFGDTAVVRYKYDCIWHYQNKRFEDDGHEIQVFLKEQDQWQMAWRTIMPGVRAVESCPTEQKTTSPGQDIKDMCLELIQSTFACQLTTIDTQGLPYTTAMNNLRCAKEYPALVSLFEGQDNDFVLYLSTSMQSDKMARMQANPKVSAYFCESNSFLGVMLAGEIEIITDQGLKDRIWQEGWTMYYPNGPHGPEYGIIKLEPTLVRGWCRNQPFEFKL